MYNWLVRIASFIGSVNNRIKLVGFLILAIQVIMLYEVISRYVFNQATTWAWDVNQLLMCGMVVLAGGYTLLNRGHVRMDLFYHRWSERQKALVNLITSFLPLIFCGVALWGVIEYTMKSISMKERYSTYFAPPIYPLWIVIVIATFLFLLQVIADIILNIKTLKEKEGLKKKNFNIT
jgi:TRAP-type mannitol/chloroaromatic compound transport system permease small subunit